MIHTRKIDEMNKHELVLLAINACNLLEDIFLIRDINEQEKYKNEHIEDFERYTKKFVRILKKLGFDKNNIDEIKQAIFDRKDFVFCDLEMSLIYTYEDNMDLDSDEAIDFGVSSYDLSKLI